MKLLTKNEIKQTKQVQTAQEIKQSIKLSDYLNTQRKGLNTFKLQKENEEQKLYKDLQEFRTDIRSKKTALQSEVDVLEERRKDALRPVKELLKKADAQLASNEADGIELKSKINETDTQKMLFILEKKKVELREDEVLGNFKKIGIQGRELTRRDNKLAKQETKFAQFSEKETEILQTKQSELDIKLKVVSQKENALEVLTKENQVAKVAVANERKKLQSQQSTLKLAFDEARRKGIL